jgi:protein-glutamine gamma-glutamyltransferase
LTGTVRRDALLQTMLCLGLALLPLGAQLPLWVITLIACCAGLRLWHREGLPLPALARTALTLAATTILLLQFRTFNGLTAGSALLSVMAGLKLLETRSARDLSILTFLVYFLCVAALLDSNSTALLLYCLAVCWLATAVLLRSLIVADPPPLAGALRQAGRICLQAAPLAIALWLFFPRLASPIWHVPSEETAMTGLGDSMSPGDLSELSLLDDPAFRVVYRDATPAPRERYFRGPVLTEFDGHTWRRDPHQFVMPVPIHAHGGQYRYMIKLEPHHRRWIFALDFPQNWDLADARLSADYSLESPWPVSAPLDIALSSATQVSYGERLTASLRRRDTARAPGRNPRSARWAQQLRSTYANDLDIVKAVLATFREEGYVYTLTPPKLAADSVDEFLFQTKRGFCGHYASAFADLMRAAGIPAHVVTGYQGGSFNRFANYWIVRQSDAHAWDEIWVDGYGWLRVDPTAAVAPNRIEGGLDLALGADEPVPGRWYVRLPWLTSVREIGDAMREWWRDRVLRYDTGKQESLLANLGVSSPDASKLGWLLAAAFAVSSLWLSWHLRRGMTPRQSSVLKQAYAAFQREVARAKLRPSSTEGPLDYGRRAAAALPALADSIAALCTDYARQRYGPAVAIEEQQRLTRALHSFRVRATRTTRR